MSEQNSPANSLSPASDDAAEQALFSRHPQIMHGRLCFAGTRIHVAAVQHYYDAGYNHDVIMKEYPDLTRAQIDAAIAAPREIEE